MGRQSTLRTWDSSSDDLHGNAPDRSAVVLLVVDVINDLNFPQNEKFSQLNLGFLPTSSGHIFVLGC